MAEKIVIGEIDIDMEQAIADTIKLRQEEERLRNETKELEKSSGKLSSEYIQSAAQLKATQTELRSQEGLLVKVSQATNAQKGSQEQLRAQLSIVTKQWSALSEQERKNTEVGQKLSKQKLELTNALKKEEIATGDARRNVGNYGDQIGQATGVLGKFVPGMGAATGAAQTFGTALKLMLGPIGLIIAAIAAMVSYFKRSEEGQNALSKITAVFTVVLNNFLDIVGKVGKALFEAVTQPRKAWEQFKGFVEGVGQFFKDTFGNVIGGSIDIFVAWLQKAFANVGLAWQKLKGIFVDNTKGINEAQNKITEYNKRIEEGQERVKTGAQNLKNGIVNAYNSAKDAITGFIKENEREIEIAKRLADQQAELNKLIRNDTIQTSKEQLKLNQLKNQIDDKINKTGEERLKLLQEENQLLDNQLSRQLNIANQKLSLKVAQDALSSSTKEDLEEEARLQAEVYNIQARIEAQRKEGVAKRAEIENQIRAEQLKTAQSAVDALQYELDFYLEANRDKLVNTQQTTDQQISIWRKALEIKIKDIDASENISEEAKNAEKLKLQNDYNLKVQKLQLDFEESERIRKLEVLQTDFENEYAINEQNIFKTLDLQIQMNELKRQEEIRAAEKTGADINLINKKYAKADLLLTRANTAAKLSLFAGLAQNIAQIAGEGTKLGKAAAVASTTINTIEGAFAAYTGMIETLPGPVGIIAGAIASAAVITSGIAQVQKILAVNENSTSTPSVQAPTSTPPVITSSLQNVNTDIGQGIVSRAVATNQQQQENQVAVLVVDDVTQKQGIENDKINTSAI